MKALSFILLATSVLAQDLTSRATRVEPWLLIEHGSVHPVSGPVIEDGWVLLRNGVIEDVGKSPFGGTPPGGARRLDAKGKHVYPGLIGAVTQLGLTEIGSVRASRDFTETGDVTPEARASVAINPDSTFFPVTRANGVLAAGVFPTGGVIPGRAGVIQLEGWTSESMTVLGDAGVVLNWPQGRGGGRGRFGPAPERSEDDQARDANAAVRRIEEFFEAAAAYHAAKRGDPKIPTDIRLEAMEGLFGTPEKPASKTTFVNAQEYDQILAAVGFATRLKLKLVIVGGRDAILLADTLKARGIGVIVSGTFRQPRRNDSPYDEAYTLPARLEAAGVKWCLASGDETPHERNLPYAAGIACAHGLTREAALRSITLSAAELLGVGEKLGSLEKGKLATLIVTDGDPLEVTTKVERAFISGREIDLSSKHTKLAEKYRAKYQEEPASGR
jgi:imidazolonepropionase-like amidohydrolase